MTSVDPWRAPWYDQCRTLEGSMEPWYDQCKDLEGSMEPSNFTRVASHTFKNFGTSM